MLSMSKHNKIVNKSNSQSWTMQMDWQLFLAKNPH